MTWDDRLDAWDVELEVAAALDGLDGSGDGSGWVPLERAARETAVSRATLRTWYGSGQIPSRLVDGPHGPQRLVPLASVAARAEISPRLRRSSERQLGGEAQLELLRHRIDQLESRLATLERRAAPSQRRPGAADPTPTGPSSTRSCAGSRQSEIRTPCQNAMRSIISVAASLGSG